MFIISYNVSNSTFWVLLEHCASLNMLQLCVLYSLGSDFPIVPVVVGVVSGLLVVAVIVVIVVLYRQGKLSKKGQIYFLVECWTSHVLPLDLVCLKVVGFLQVMLLPIGRFL